jgi:hypothetical protein
LCQLRFLVMVFDKIIAKPELQQVNFKTFTLQIFRNSTASATGDNIFFDGDQ